MRYSVIASTIIVGIDGSALARDAASAGIQLLREPDLVVITMVVEEVDWPMVQGAPGLAGPAAEVDERREAQRRVEREAAEVALGEVKDSLGQDHVTTRVVEGSAGPELCRLASEASASAIVVGTRGRGGLKRAVLGSVSDYVVRNAPCAVVVVGDMDDRAAP